MFGLLGVLIDRNGDPPELLVTSIVAQLRLTKPVLPTPPLCGGAAMELFRAEKIATVQDQSNHDCRFCGERLTLLKTIMESESGDVIHIFECEQCGERIWKD